MKVNVDMTLCQSNGACVIEAPDVFDLDDDDELHWSEEVGEERRDEVERAVAACPLQAISTEG